MGMVFDEVHDGMHTAMHCSSVFCGAAEVSPSRSFLVACHVDGVPHDLVHSFVLHGTDGDNGYAEHFFHLVDVYCSAIVSHFVHHVEGKDDGDIEFHQLYGQIEIALYVCCIGQGIG